MGKPAAKPTWTGTSGSDIKAVANLSDLKNTNYDAGAGYDTLDLSALTTGVTLRLSSATQGNKVLSHSTLWADGPFHGSWWTWDAFAPTGTMTADSVLNFEGCGHAG